jgi:hypothetical protein
VIGLLGTKFSVNHRLPWGVSAIEFVGEDSELVGREMSRMFRVRTWPPIGESVHIGYELAPFLG